MVKRFILLFVAVLFVNLLAAQSKVLLIGVVFDHNINPLQNAIVAESGTSNAVFTDAQGRYLLYVDAGKSLKIIYSMVGYQKEEYNINVVNETVTLNAILFPESKILNPATVTGNRRRTDTFNNLDVSDTRFLPSASGGAVEALVSSLGGVSSTNELSSQYSVRGGNFDENIVYVNGIEIYRPLSIRQGQQEGLSFINPRMVQTVEFSAGGFGAQYGDKMSSVLNIAYRQPERFEASVEGSLLGANAYIGTSTGAFSQITGIRYKTTRSLLGTTDTKAEYDPDFLDAQTFMTFKFSPNWKAEFTGNYSHNTYRFTPQTRDTRFGTLAVARQLKVYFDGWEKDRFTNYHAALNLKGQIGDNVAVSLAGALFSSDEQEHYDIEGRYRLSELLIDENGQVQSGEGNLLGVGTNLEHARNKLNADIYNLSHTGSFVNDDNTLRWGFTYQHEKLRDYINEWEMRDSSGYSLPSDGKLVNVYSNLKARNRLESSRYSAFLQDTYKLNSSTGLFVFNAGVRGSYWDYNKEWIFSPRASVAFIPSSADQFTLHFATGIYYQAPFYKELQRNIRTADGNNTIELNQNIKSQKSLQFVLGTDYHFMTNYRPFKLTGELYYKKLSNLIPYTVNNVKIRYAGENLAKGYSMGLDMRLYGEFVKGTDSWISFSLMKTDQKIGENKFPLPTDQRYNVSIFFQDYLPGYERLTMTLLGSFSQGLPMTAPHKGYEFGYFRPPAYKRFDIGFAWQLLGKDFKIRNRNSFCHAFKNIWLGLDVFNIFDIDNTNTYYWVSDVYNQQYAVPNYLTGRQLNVKLIAEF